MADKRISQLIERTDIANNDVLPIVASGATTTNKVTISTIQDWMQENLDVGVTSVGLSMPSAFTVTNSPVTTSGNISVAGAGTVSQYIRGDGSLADFPSISGGGSSVSYYLNGSVSQGTIGGVAYTELSKVPILGAGTDFTINADGYIASFITDAGDPSLLQIPGGNWNFETYFQASSGGGSPTFYVELYKVSGSTATLIATSSGSPELIAFGTNITPYFSSLAVPTTTLALTDRLAIRYYVTHSGRTITLHTENNTLCQIITTFTTGLTALNGLTAQVQNFATGTSGTDFNISSSGTTHTFNIPSASADNRGLITTGSQTIAGAKTFSVDAVINGVNVGRGSGSISTNTRVGTSALTNNTTGSSNTGVGLLALGNNSTGARNTSIGEGALMNNTTGNDNVAVGVAAGVFLTDGSSQNSISNGSVFIGVSTRSSVNNQTNQIVIGHNAIGNGSNTVTIGNSSITNTYLRGTVQLTDTGTASSINIISNSTGNGAINIEKNTNGTGIRVSNAGIGQGIFANNSSTGTGILIGNTSTGKGLYIDNASGATGDPFVYSLGGAAFVKAKIDSQGNITGNSFIKSSGTSSQFLKADGSVDSNAYLPLIGGTLSGSLGGTSASFSGDIQTSTRLIASNPGGSIILTANLASTTNRIESTNLPLEIFTSGSELKLRAGAGNAQVTLASTGAVTLTGALGGTTASFSGNVTSTAGNFRLFNGYYLTAKRADGADINVIGFPSGSNNLTSVTAGDYNLQNTGGTNLFSVSSSGVATANRFNTGNGALSQGGFWGTQITAGTGSFANFALLDAGTNGIMYNPTGTLNMTFTGNVGIGITSSANYPLLISRSTAGVGLQIENSTTYSHLRLQSSGTNSDSYLTLNPTGTGAAFIQVGDINRFRISSSGDSTFFGNVTSSGFLSSNDRLYMPGNRPISDWFSSSLTAGYSSTNGYGWVNGAGNLLLGTNGVERIRITDNGRVGIGTDNPSDILTVVGNINLPNGVNRQITIGSQTNYNYRLGTDGDDFRILEASTTERLRYSYLNTRWNITGGLAVSGSLSKGSGSFKIDHPLPEKKDTHHLVHSFIEGPQADNIYRGKIELVHGSAEVNIDNSSGMSEGTFVLLNGNIQCFTSNESGWTPVKGKVEGNILKIEAQDSKCKDTISWLIIGERIDQHMIDTDWTDENGKVIVEPLKDKVKIVEEQNENQTEDESNT
jgi:hypothetical protein